MGLSLSFKILSVRGQMCPAARMLTGRIFACGLPAGVPRIVRMCQASPKVTTCVPSRDSPDNRQCYCRNKHNLHNRPGDQSVSKVNYYFSLSLFVKNYVSCHAYEYIFRTSFISFVPGTFHIIEKD